MGTNRITKPQGFPQPGGGGYEQRDAHVGWIFGIITFLALSCVIIQFIIGGTMERLGKSSAPTDQWKTSLRAQPAVPSRPPFPRLQVASTADLVKFRVREEAELNTYGWVDKQAGIVRIPINRAMDLLLERGLPTRSETNNSSPGPSTYQLIQKRTPNP